MSDRAFEELKTLTKEDEELLELTRLVQNDWPKNVYEVKKTMRHYWNYREEIAQYEGILCKGERVIIPKKMQQQVLKSIHEGHLGIQSCLKRERESVYWTQMNNDVKNMINKCSICQSRQRDTQPEPIISRGIPNRPWQTVSTDMFYFNSNEYILIADHYSNWIDIKKLKETSSAEIIDHIKDWFATHGIPDTLVSDNGPQYASKEFRQFTEEWKFNHSTSSPHYPKSNGFSERNVQTAKNILRKCEDDKTDHRIAFLNLRNTPRNTSLGSPNQRLFNRRTKTLLPTCETKLQPKVIEEVQDNFEKLRDIQKKYADEHTKLQPQPQPGENVRIRKKHREWEGGKVIANTENPRSVLVETNDGRVYRRNSSHVRPTEANIQKNTEVAVDVKGEQGRTNNETNEDKPNPPSIQTHTRS